MQRFQNPVVLFCVGILVLTVLSLAVLAVMKTAKTAPLAAKSAQAASPQTLLRNTIKSAFNSKDGSGILAYLDLAFEQKQPLQRYDYLKKTFEKMIASYNIVKAPEKKLAMGKLKVYASNLPNYKESDFVIPK